MSYNLSNFIKLDFTGESNTMICQVCGKRQTLAIKDQFGAHKVWTGQKTKNGMLYQKNIKTNKDALKHFRDVHALEHFNTVDMKV